MARLNKSDIENARKVGRNSIGEEATLYISTHYIGNVGTALSRVYIIGKGFGDVDELFNVTNVVAIATESKPHTKDGRDYLKTTGYGYNRAQHIADNLSYALFGRHDALAYEEI